MAKAAGGQKLRGKVALVTGSSRGIGKAIVMELAKEGADIVVAARTVEKKDWIPGTIGDTVDEVKALGRRALAVQADLVNRADIDNLAKTALDAFGRVDILVNNAAFFGKAAYHTAWEMSVKSWDLQIALNLTAPFLLCHALAPRMKEQGGGIIVNVSSGSAIPGPDSPPGIAYGTSKAALNRLTFSLARDYRPANIAVVALDPGFTRTEITEIGAAAAGRDASNAHPVEVPAKAAWHLITFGDPMWYTGKVVVAADLVREHNLV